VIYLAADLHLDKSLRNSMRELELDSLFALRALKDLILQLKAESQDEYHNLILAGDIFNEPKTSGRVFDAFGVFCSDLWKNNVKTWFIQGNHDRQPTYSKDAVPLASACGALNLHDVLMPMDDLQVLGFDYASPEQIKERISKCAACDLLVLHQPFEAVLGFDGAWDLNFEHIPERVRNVCAGDVHQTVKIKMPGNQGWFLSPGAMHPCDISQGGDHGIFVRPKNGEWEFRSIISRPVYKFEVTPGDLPEPEEFLASLPPSAREPIVALTHAPELCDYIERLRTASIGRAVIIAQPSYSGKALATQSAIKEASSMASEQITLGQALPFILHKQDEPEVYDLVEELLNNPDASSLLERYVKEYLQ
jgi:hypothetical protein